MRKLRVGLRIIEQDAKVEASLWRRWQSNKDVNCRIALFDKFRGFARSQAKRSFHTRPAYGLELEDFEQLALSGLLQAIDKYDPGLGAPFKSYAKHRIQGSISDGLKHSSEASEQYSYRTRIEAERLQSLRMGETAGVTAIEVVGELAASLALGIMLEEAGLLFTQDSIDPAPGAYDAIVYKELSRMLSIEIENLGEPDKSVLVQHYLHGVAFVEIAAMLSLSKGRVSQIHRRALKWLKKRLRKFQ